MSTSSTLPRSRDVALDGGGSLHALEAGEPGAPAFVLLHGWPQAAASWAPLMRAAAGADAHLVAIDLPGIGGSPPVAGGGSKAVIAETVGRLIATLGLEGATLVGHDAGGMAAYAYLRRRSDVARVAIVETVVPGVDPWDAVIGNPFIWHFAFHGTPDLPELLARGRQAPYFDWFFDALSADPARVTREARADAVAAYATDAGLSAGFDLYRALPQDARDNAASAAGAEVDTPLLYVRGGASPVDVDAYLDGFRRAGVRDVRSAVVEDAGHFLPDERPEALWAVLRDFAAA